MQTRWMTHDVCMIRYLGCLLYIRMLLSSLSAFDFTMLLLLLWLKILSDRSSRLKEQQSEYLHHLGIRDRGT